MLVHIFVHFSVVSSERLIWSYFSVLTGTLQWIEQGQKFFDSLPIKKYGLCLLPLQTGCTAGQENIAEVTLWYLLSTDFKRLTTSFSCLLESCYQCGRKPITLQRTLCERNGGTNSSAIWKSDLGSRSSSHKAVPEDATWKRDNLSISSAQIADSWVE